MTAAPQDPQENGTSRDGAPSDVDQQEGGPGSRTGESGGERNDTASGGIPDDAKDDDTASASSNGDVDGDDQDDAGRGRTDA
ncbi:hypothetical protein PZ938_08765 [Luteipulveratus sp. YIM 133132]|uniref:hypothetical protein n=1 Tax=Luteipulveratus flavus TaxID=3031728 RepID=UPI0023B13110|nr:hypothetical protein [Luteipulveratus sp. YIM 133132]MDE9365694.1 hypothetical protein [Luteipulveratus sp. YIM 133132]